MKILVADDSLLNRKILKNALEKHGMQVIEAVDGREAIDVIERFSEEIGVITLDRDMLEVSGEEVVKKIRQDDKVKDIPVIFISSLAEKSDIEWGLEVGVYDYISKPIDPYITFLKVKNALNYYKTVLDVRMSEKTIAAMNSELVENYSKIDELNRRVLEKNKILEVLVDARTKELNEMTVALITILENANYYNDENTGNHIKRVAEYSELIAREAGLDAELVKDIKIYAPLHDIGKVGVSDAILKKPGKFTPEEFNEMKKHVQIGYNMIKESPLSQVAKNIIRHHHEKYDGSGYLEGLVGEAIPIEARIVAIADVFDALSTKRIYKEAFPMEEVEAIMMEGRGKHFDPVLLDIFFREKETVIMLRDKYRDQEL